MLIFDAHLDLSLNAIEYDRDLRHSVAAIREDEAGKSDLGGRACGTVAFPEMRKGGIGLCVATQLAGAMKPRGPCATWNSPEQAWAMTQGQLAWYRTMEDAGELVSIRDRAHLDAHVALWSAGTVPANAPIGYILSLEGADSILTLAHLERSWNDGLRALGPAHYGEGRYALGHDMNGPLKPAGRDLLREMDRLGIILDATHLCDETLADALELFGGPVWASHSNCRALVPDPRQFSDQQILALIERGAVLGAAFDAWMMVPGWIRGKTTPQEAGVKIAHIVDHIDHICQLAGNANHVGIGSDLDGGFGKNQSPEDLDTIADLAALPNLLSARGFTPENIQNIMHANFINFLQKAWS